MMLKQTRGTIDVGLVLAIAAIAFIGLFGLSILEWICTHNILRGEW